MCCPKERKLVVLSLDTITLIISVFFQIFGTLTFVKFRSHITCHFQVGENGITFIRTTLYPERFADIKIEDEVRAFYRDCYGIELTPERARTLFPIDHK